MFERMQELLKDQPDWLEVPMPTGMYEDLKQALVQFGASPEQAVNLFAQRIIAVAAKDRPKPTQHTIAKLTIQDMLPQMMIEPEGHFFHINLPNYAAPAFVTLQKDYFGSLEDIDAFMSLLDENEQQQVGSVQLTPVPIMGTRSAQNRDYQVAHQNIYGFPYYMSSRMVESVHVWLKYDNRYYRCIRARMDRLHYSDELDDSLKPLHGISWGFPHIIEYAEPYTYNRLYEKEKVFDTWEEAERDMKAFTCEIVLTEVFNDIFGDG